MRASDEYREDRLEGMELGSLRRPMDFGNGFTRKTLWAVTVAKMYLASLRTGQIPNYPTEPDDAVPGRSRFLYKKSGGQK